jgi:transcription antitermination factor NusG
MSKFNAGWYLIYTKPRQEKKVYTRLSELKVTSFLPTKRTLRTWHDRRKFVEEPLFPSYVFVYLNNMQSYYHGIDADGALHYVKTGKKMALVSDAVVNNIKLCTDRAEEIEVTDNTFVPGRKLVISHGALTGLACEVVQCNNKEKLLVRVDLLQRSILLTISEDYLIPA